MIQVLFELSGCRSTFTDVSFSGGGQLAIRSRYVITQPCCRTRPSSSNVHWPATRSLNGFDRNFSESEWIVVERCSFHTIAGISVINQPLSVHRSTFSDSRFAIELVSQVL